MKKLVKIITALSLMFALVACKNNIAETEAVVTTVTEFYRTIAVASSNGEVYVAHKDGEKIKAYDGMLLVDGDKVEVGKESDLTLNVDSDKHLFAEENTLFTINAQGTEESNQTQIVLDSGSVLCQIKEKLKDSESFDVVTKSSTMSVRGTVFRTSVITSSDENAYEMVEVYDGKVWSSISEADEEVTLEPGQCAMVQQGTDDKAASYVTEDQIDSTFWDSNDTNMYVTKETGTGSPVLKIAYNKLSNKVVGQLIVISEEGTELSLSTEELTKLDERIKANEQKTKEQIAQEALEKGITNETDFRSGALNDDICAEYGHTIVTVNGVKQCTVCGRKFNDTYKETEQDTANREALEQEGLGDITLPSGKASKKVDSDTFDEAETDNLKQNEQGTKSNQDSNNDAQKETFEESGELLDGKGPQQ